MSEDWLDPEKVSALIKRARKAIKVSQAVASNQRAELAQKKVVDKKEG